MTYQQVSFNSSVTLSSDAIWDLLLNLGVPYATADKFITYHNHNPQVWREFEELTLDAISHGLTRWGAKGIAEVIRWRLSIKTRGEFKLNNNFVSYYARVFALKYPQFADFFEFRKIQGLDND